MPLSWTYLGSLRYIVRRISGGGGGGGLLASALQNLFSIELFLLDFSLISKLAYLSNTKPIFLIFQFSEKLQFTCLVRCEKIYNCPNSVYESGRGGLVGRASAS